MTATMTMLSHFSHSPSLIFHPPSHISPIPHLTHLPFPISHIFHPPSHIYHPPSHTFPISHLPSPVCYHIYYKPSTLHLAHTLVLKNWLRPMLGPVATGQNQLVNTNWTDVNWSHAVQSGCIDLTVQLQPVVVVAHQGLKTGPN